MPRHARWRQASKPIPRLAPVTTAIRSSIPSDPILTCWRQEESQDHRPPRHNVFSACHLLCLLTEEFEGQTAPHAPLEGQRDPQRSDGVHQLDLVEIAHPHRPGPDVLYQRLDDRARLVVGAAVEQVRLSFTEAGILKVLPAQGIKGTKYLFSSVISFFPYSEFRR